MAPLTLDTPARAGHPSRRDEHELWERFQLDRDPRDRAALVRRFLPLARHLSRKYHGAGESDDLEQVAALGLLKAIDRFDPSRGIAFTSFAVPTILGELKRYFRDLGWTVRVPRSLQELGQRVNRTAEAMQLELGRSPTVAELAERCECTPEEVIEARNLPSAHHAVSLDAPVDDDAATRLETLGREDEGFRRAEASADADRLLATLPARERAVLHLRFREDLTQQAIADCLGTSQMHVSRLLRTTLASLASDREHRPVRGRALWAASNP
jgi:RNA polymerase sigma-B factor